MPFYKWHGVDLLATSCSGKLYAASIEELNNKLRQKNIALLRARPIKIIYYRKPRLADKMAVATHLSYLIKAGISMPQALELVGNQFANKALACMLYEASQKVAQGQSLSNAMRSYTIFDPLLVRLVEISKHTGNVERAFDQAINYLSERQILYRTLWSAASTPLITFFLFMGISIFALLVLIPQFAHLYQSMNTQLPESTQKLLMMNQLANDKDLYVLGGMAIACCASIYLCMKRFLKKIIMVTFWYFPICSRVMHSYVYALFFDSVGYQLQFGIPLAEALKSSIVIINNLPVITLFRRLIQEVESGMALACAMVQANLWQQDIIAMINIGYESGTLATMITAIGIRYRQDFQKQLEKITFFFQPFLLLVLGLMISYFVYALYVPIFSVGNSF